VRKGNQKEHNLWGKKESEKRVSPQKARMCKAEGHCDGPARTERTPIEEYFRLKGKWEEGKEW